MGGLRLHDLRHSYTSIMIAAGVNIKAISQSLGHANIGITLDTYNFGLPGSSFGFALSSGFIAGENAVKYVLAIRK